MAANIHLNFNLQPVEIRALCQKVIDADIETLDKVASLKESEVSLFTYFLFCSGPMKGFIVAVTE